MTKTPTPITIVERITAWTGSIPSLILHTFVFAGALLLGAFSIAPWDTVLLVLTTMVSLEAIYLSLLIQITVNRNTKSLREVEEDIDEIQEDVEELGEDMDEIQEDIEEISEDLEEIQEDVEEMSEEEKADETRKKNQSRTLEELTSDMRRILDELETLKKKT